VFVQDPRPAGSETDAQRGAPTGPQLVVWGTDVVVSQCKEQFVKFMERYIDRNVASDEKFEGMDMDEPIYMQKLEEV